MLRAIVVSIVAVWITFNSTTFGDDRQSIQERRIQDVHAALDRLTGTWERTSDTIIKGQVVESKVASVSAKWILKDNYLHETGTWFSGEEFLALNSYDFHRHNREEPSIRCTIMQSKFGPPMELIGTWKPATNSLVFTGAPNTGSTIEFSYTFDAADSYTFRYVEKDFVGKHIFREVIGKAKRVSTP